ncbi:DNA helicase MCM9 isoform X3 [Gopherus evgoodei]|uniref:DNA helicase MCM9 isoform X3 n=1 Tax=Gopherus evgoodei TaxID=1825980 RepID=UPI0011CF7D7E|nr:DNA helicase MCM9 isoform X3 [Gopherus evgoodei]
MQPLVGLEQVCFLAACSNITQKGGALLGGINALHTSFPENPMEQYRMQCELILERLELQNLLHEEFKRLDRLQNENSCQLQPGETSKNTAYGSLSDGTFGQSEQMSQTELSDQQGNNCKQQNSLVKGRSKADTHLEPSTCQAAGKNRDTNNLSKHNDSRADGSLTWFDSMVDDNMDAEESVQQSLIPTRPLDNLALKTMNDKSCSKEKSGSRQSRETGMGQSLATVDLSATSRQDVVSGIDEKRTKGHKNLYSEANIKDPASENASVPDSVVTQQVSKRWQRLRTERAHNFCASTQDPKADTLPSPLFFPSAADPQVPSGDMNNVCAIGKSRNNVPVVADKQITSMRKRNKDQTVKEAMATGSNEPEIIESEGPPVAKLAKFSFRQRTKFVHPSESKSNAELPPSQSEAVFTPHRILRTVAEGEQPEEECYRPAKHQKKLMSLGNSSLEKRPLDNKRKEQQQNETLRREIKEATTGHSETKQISDIRHHAGLTPTAEKTRKGEEMPGGLSTKKVCSSTLAKLARFSFMSPPESKSENPPSLNVTSNSKESQGLPLKTHSESTSSKRKCFGLGSASNKNVVTGKSLFSIPDLDDATLDFDWDEEIRKNPRS